MLQIHTSQSVQHTNFSQPSVIGKLEHAPDATPEFIHKSICLSLKLSSLGIRKKVATSLIQTDADEDLVHVAKDILESETFKDIKSLDGDIKKYIRSVWIPSPMFKSGIYLIPIVNLEEIDNKLEGFKVQRRELVQKFILEYPTLKEAAIAKLGSLFNPLDYPSVHKIQAAFDMDTRYVTFATPGKLKEISPAIWQREMDKAEAELKQAAAEIKGALRENMADLVEHLMSRLEPGDEGRKKKFHESAIGNFEAFLDTFSSRNVVNDEDLAKIVEEAKGLLGGVAAPTIRSNAELRDQLHNKFGEIKTKLDTMLVDRPRRKFGKIKEEPKEE